MTLHAPVRLGDRITTTQTIRDISDEKTTRVGTGRFWTIDVTYRNQNGELKGIETYEMFSYKR
jgi:acyl dehydratase